LSNGTDICLRKLILRDFDEKWGSGKKRVQGVRRR
jgi:hypothetical protein